MAANPTKLASVRSPRSRLDRSSGWDWRGLSSFRASRCSRPLHWPLTARSISPGAIPPCMPSDAVNGKLLWKHDPEVWKHNPAKMNYIFGANRGAAYAEGRVFVCTMDGRLLALDAKTGQLQWSVETVERDDKRTSTGAPRTFNGKVIIGHGGGRPGNARLCHCVRPGHRPTGLALLRGAWMSRGEQRRSGHGARRRDVERRILEDRYRRRRRGTELLSTLS